jgi:hypothetical protein
VRNILPAMPGAFRQRSFNSAMRFVLVVVMAWTPFCFSRLIATCKGSHRPAEAVNCKRRASTTQIKARAHRRNFDCLFLLLKINRLKKSIAIPRSRLLQFAARAIHCPVSRKFYVLLGASPGLLRKSQNLPYAYGKSGRGRPSRLTSPAMSEKIRFAVASISPDYL